MASVQGDRTARLVLDRHFTAGIQRRLQLMGVFVQDEPRCWDEYTGRLPDKRKELSTSSIDPSSERHSLSLSSFLVSAFSAVRMASPHVAAIGYQLTCFRGITWKRGRMGQYDSSLTRVVPAFDQLMARDSSGRSWIRELIETGSRAQDIQLPAELGALLPGHPAYWGRRERRLPAPAALLEWLVENIDPNAVASSGDTGDTRRRREALAARDPVVVEEALRRIRAGERGRKWFILEGESSPDAFLETESIILVVEGKRTERAATISTKWMSQRNQLLRHMDAATEVAGKKRVFGLMIVEAETGDSVPTTWAGDFEDSLRPAAVRATLPHRNDEEKQRIVAGVAGVTTWQALHGRFSLTYPDLVLPNP